MPSATCRRAPTRSPFSLKGFEDFVKPGIVIARGQPQVVNAQLSVAVEKQQITVTDETTKVSVNP